MRDRSEIHLIDPLYGDIVLNGPIADLSYTPGIQRLREIRLSNIDSICMPGIANISRYEHSIGVAYLASHLGLFAHLSKIDKMVLQAAGIMHDFAISAFGHLVEEALQYISEDIKHELKLSVLLQRPMDGEVGGIDLQVYEGRQSGIKNWADHTFESEAEARLQEIVEALKGKGRFGPCIAGDIDLDNLDNLIRIAFHMGLKVDKLLPTIISSGILESNEKDGVIISEEIIEPIKKWLDLRRVVYNRLMLSRDDFTGKVMLIYATITAYKREELGHDKYAWTLTDRELIQRLLQSKDKDVVRTVQSWLIRDIWPLSDLIWMEGVAPKYGLIYKFNEFISNDLKRPCFAYGITDKRTRSLNLRLKTGEIVHLGASPSGWILGVASRNRSNFTIAHNRDILKAATVFFNTKCIGKANEVSPNKYPLFK